MSKQGSKRAPKSFSKTVVIEGRKEKFSFGDGPPARYARALFERWSLLQQINRDRIRSLKTQLDTLDRRILHCDEIAVKLYGALLTSVGYSQSPERKWGRISIPDDPRKHLSQRLIRRLRETKGGDQSEVLTDTLLAVKNADPNSVPPTPGRLAALQRQSGKIGSADPADQWDLNQLLEENNGVWFEAYHEVLNVIGVVGDKLSAIHRVPRQQLLEDQWSLIREVAPPDGLVSPIEQLLVLRIVLATLWADHAADVRDFAAANLGPEFSKFALKRLTRVNLRIRPAENLLKKLSRKFLDEERMRIFMMRSLGFEAQ